MGSISQGSLKLAAITAVEGIKKNLATVTTIALAGVSYTPTSLTSFLEEFVALFTALSAAHDQLHALVEEEGPATTQLLSVLRALDAFVLNLYGADPVKLGEFGFSPKKVGVETVATKAAAIAKAKATRIARHTMGSKQKLSITGSTTEPPAAPPADPVTPAPVATPAVAHAASGAARA